MRAREGEKETLHAPVLGCTFLLNFYSCVRNWETQNNNTSYLFYTNNAFSLDINA